MTDKNKIILFLCKCSSNISNVVNFETVTEWAKKSRDVDVVVTGNLLCSPKEKALFSKIIKERKVRGIVVAACSPKLHEKTFQDLAEEAGINMSKVQMANIREQCAWVTTDKEEATTKAISLINAAVKRVFEAKDLERRTMEVNSDVLIIGGGIAGIKTALSLSKTGRKVYLVEKNISLGGFLIKTEEVAPNMECAPCLLAPVLSDVRDDPNIEVISHARVLDVLGFFGNYTVKVERKARYVKDNCIACEECFNVCPVSVSNDFHHGLGERKAIYNLFAGSVPAACIIDKDNCKHFIDGSCNECVGICPFESIDFDDKDEELTLSVGSIVVATGFDSGSLENFPELGYQKLDDVYTISEFERLASSNGPSNSTITLKDGKAPGSIAVIHCAGSMNEKGIPYCSGVCCTNAVKVGELARKTNPDINVFNIYNQLVFPHPAEYDFFTEQLEKGTRFARCLDLSTVNVEKVDNGALLVKADGVHIAEVDMVVLSTGLAPAKDTKMLSEMLNVELDEKGYFKCDHEILHRTGSAIAGIYTVGCATSPCNAATSMTRAQAVAGDILNKLVPGKEIELEIMTAAIDEDKCAGCKLCITVCPYKAIYFDADKKISVINEAICHGCGTCAATCAGGACTAKHFDDTQIYAEIGGVLNA